MTLLNIKTAIWHHKKIHCNKVDLQVEADKAGVELPISQICEAEKLLKALNKKGKKRKGERVSKEIYKRYRDAKYAYELIHLPHVVKDGHFLEPYYPTDDTNGLTDFICEYLNWTGHVGNPTSNEGRVIIKDKKPVRIPTKSINGMQDIEASLAHPQHPYGIAWKIEVKAGNDTHKEHQKEYGRRVAATGAVYSVVRSAEDFFEQLDKLLILAPIQTTLL